MLLTAPNLARAGFVHAFPTRDEPRLALPERLGVPAIAEVRQVHGARVVDAARLTATEEADAIVARAAGTAVGVRVADCVPILLADPQTGAVAAVHAGWRGIVAGVVPAAVRALGGSALVAAVGPSIGPCCFEVGREVAAQIAAACTASGGDRGAGATIVVRREGAKAYVDLRAAVRAELRASGLDDARIDDVPGCTKHEAHFHSYRRDGPASGRMLAAVVAR